MVYLKMCSQGNLKVLKTNLIVPFFIQNLNLGKLVAKLKFRQIYLTNCILVNSKVLIRIWHQYFKVLCLKYNFRQIGPNVIASSNLCITSHASQFEDRKYKYDMIIFRFKLKFWEMFVQYSNSFRST